MICMFKAIHYWFQIYLKTLETSVLKLKKELEAEYAMQYIGMRKQIINI